MPTLLDVPTRNESLLLGVVAQCFYDAGDKWPVWQYVVRQLAELQPDLDAFEVLSGMPVWRHNYRYVDVDSRGGVGPADAASVQLTISGMHHSGNGRMADLAQAFVIAIRLAARRQRSVEPEPLRAVPISFVGSELTEAVHRQSGVAIPTLLLSSLLANEPITGRGLEGSEGAAWIWHLEHARLGKYWNLQSTEAYLESLDAIVGYPPVEATSVPLPAAAIPDAIDHVNAVWRNVFGEPLLEVKVAGVVTRLTQPVMSEDEFTSRCSELSIVFNWFRTSRKADKATGQRAMGSLAGLQILLAEKLGPRNPAVEAVSVLRYIAAVRTGQQHNETNDQASNAKALLGIAALGGDWAASWEVVRHRLVDSLRVIRQELQA